MYRLGLMFFLVIMLSCFMACSCSNKCDEAKDGVAECDTSSFDYYWYQGERIFLKRKISKEFVLFYAENESDIARVARMTGNKDYKSTKFVLTHVTPLSKTNAEKKEQRWCILRNASAQIKQLEKESKIIYRGAFYEDGDDGIGLSHLFFVKLKTQEDRDVLYDMASKYGVEVMGYNMLMSQWYTLSCDLNSAGNSLQMANVFYESGLFESAEPDFIGAVKLV